MTTERTNQRGGLWLRWVLANAAGLALGLALWGIISDTLGEYSPINIPVANVAFSIVAFLSVGAVAGTLQWLALRTVLDLSRLNILVGSAGYAVGFIVGFELAGPPADFVLGFLLFVMGTSIVQWLALRRQVGRAGWWVPASVLALIIGGLVAVVVIDPFAAALDTALGSESLLAFAVILALLGTIAGAIGGAISGAVLLWLLRQPAPDPATTARPSIAES